MESKVKDDLLARQRAYLSTFKTQSAIPVMEDLKLFCRGEESCFNSDQRIHAVLEGRREVYLRIKKHIDNNAEEFLKYYTRNIDE